MMYKLLVMAHVLGAAIWIGGHIVLLAVVLPLAKRRKSVEGIKEFEYAFGKYAIGALAAQVLTGVMLAPHWIGDWSAIFKTPAPATHLVMTKFLLLIIIGGFAGYAAHRVIPRLTWENLRTFELHAWIVTGLSLLLLVAGVGIRTGGLF